MNAPVCIFFAFVVELLANHEPDQDNTITKHFDSNLTFVCGDLCWAFLLFFSHVCYSSPDGLPVVFAFEILPVLAFAVCRDRLLLFGIIFLPASSH